MRISQKVAPQKVTHSIDQMGNELLLAWRLENHTQLSTTSDKFDFGIALDIVHNDVNHQILKETTISNIKMKCKQD
jgi:hypothetical protein